MEFSSDVVENLEELKIMRVPKVELSSIEFHFAQERQMELDMGLEFHKGDSVLLKSYGNPRWDWDGIDVRI